jgi:2-oxo-4-hydroxy-4-carboxy-5-ureidoimidazoline decarboxylase
MAALSLNDLNAATRAEFVSSLANIFENSPWIAEAAESARPFATLIDLRLAMLDAVEQAPQNRRRTLIRAHPDLADRLQRVAGLTPESVREQDGAGLDRLSDAEFARFEEANATYKARFGFPFILCVRRHTKDSILDAFDRRLGNTAAAEERQALGEIARIATLRLAALFENGAALGAYGRLSTHVLDTHAGKPATGVGIELVELSHHAPGRVIAQAITNADGRTDPPLVHSRPVPIGAYELRFRAADYYVRRQAPLSDPPFYDVIPVRFTVSEPEAQLHVPLLMTPWGYTTYRGN